jgi:sugar lactone lactonase YvrE
MKFYLTLLLILLTMGGFQPSGTIPATLVLDARTKLGEGSIWQPLENKLYWVDIEGMALHIYDPLTKKDIHFSTGSRTSTVVPLKNGGALIAMQNGIHKIDCKTGKLTLVCNPLSDPNIRFNDGKCDPSGRFWVGTMDLSFKKGAAVLYRMDYDKSIKQVLDSVTISNGIVWTADRKTMYYIDTPTGTVEAFDYDDASGTISNRRVAIRVPQGMGSPDGMTIDRHGNLWVALWGGGAVACFDPLTGELLKKVIVPAPNTSSCAFGGKNLDILYITSGREGLSAEELKKYPLSGGLFSAKPGVRGVPAFFYKGQL